MPSHPNRSRRHNPAANPKPEQIRQARESAGLTQTEAATMVHSGVRKWQKWESGTHRMHPALWELFRAKSSGEFPQISPEFPQTRK